jgi:hypothetical protein
LSLYWIGGMDSNFCTYDGCFGSHLLTSFSPYP